MYKASANSVSFSNAPNRRVAQSGRQSALGSYTEGYAATSTARKPTRLAIQLSPIQDAKEPKVVEDLTDDEDDKNHVPSTTSESHGGEPLFGDRYPGNGVAYYTGGGGTSGD